MATAPDMLAANLIMPAASNANSAPISFVVQTHATNVEFWVYTTGEQNASFALPPGLGGAATVQLDGRAASQVQAQNSSLAVGLGMSPTQDRIQPPPALAGKAPSDWPGPKPAIGILNFPGFPTSWTTNSPSDWALAFAQSPLVTEFGLPVIDITTYTDLTNALQAGPASWFAILNPYGECFPEPAQGQWTNLLNLVGNYVNNGGSFWETAGYSFYVGGWFESNAWQTEVVGPNGMDTFGIPVGGGANAQPPEPLTVTATGETFFGPTLSAQLRGLPAIVNRGLLPDSSDPGHIALLSGAQQDYLGAYRLGGWGYLWRIGGFLPNPEVVLPAVPAVMAYLYTNAPLPALVSSVSYLWHGTIAFPGPPAIQAIPTTNAGAILQLGNCPLGSAIYLERSPSLNNPNWRTVLSFTSPPVQTNWTDLTASGLSEAFYRIRSIPAP
jgi:hypothetical protein